LAEVKERDFKKTTLLQENVETLKASLQVEEKKVFEVSHTLIRCEDDLKVSVGLG